MAAGASTGRQSPAPAPTANPEGKLSQAPLNPTPGPTPGATSLNLSDSPVPNPLRNARRSAPKKLAPGQMAPEQMAAGQATSPVQQTARPVATFDTVSDTNSDKAAGKSSGKGSGRPFAVQTVGYQEELPIVAGSVAAETEGPMRLVGLEEPEPTVAEPASVLMADSAERPTVDGLADPAVSGLAASDPNASSLPIEANASDPAEAVFSDQAEENGAPQSASGWNNRSGEGNQAGEVGPAQGHYQQGTAVYGQVLNAPQQPASQRALQLLEENRQLQEDLQAQLKTIEELQARLKQQDDLWARARQEFLDVRRVVDRLTRENLLLKQQLEKSNTEKADLARQYQNLMQTVEQTLDDLLLRAITEPSSSAPASATPAGGGLPPSTSSVPLTDEPPAGAAPAAQPTTPPITQPATQPTPTPPANSGQQASAPKTSR